MDDVEVLSTRMTENSQQRSQMKTYRPLQSLDPQTLNYLMQSQFEMFPMARELQTAQSVHQYQHQQLLPPPPASSRTYEKLHQSYRPIRRKRRKSRQERKVGNHLNELDNWQNRLELNVTKFIEPTKSILTKIDMMHGNRGNKMFTMNLDEQDEMKKMSHLLNRSNGVGGDSLVEMDKLKNLNKHRNGTKTPYTMSTSAGGSQMVVVSSSRTVSTSTDRTNGKKHRKELLKQRTTKSPTHFIQSSSTHLFNDGPFLLRNKYNIDYDNKLEDEYEIIMKDE